MKRLLSIGIVALVCSAGAAGATSSSPTLRVTGVAPVRIVGTGFKARERVTVVVTAGARRLTRFVTTRGGAFVATFDLSLPRCGTGFEATATGAGGDKALYRYTSRDCAQP